jgi:hypothetical protein
MPNMEDIQQNSVPVPAKIHTKTRHKEQENCYGTVKLVFEMTEVTKLYNTFFDSEQKLRPKDHKYWE